MRIAWIGPSPTCDGGATYVATQLLRELARAGAEVDCYLGARPEELPDVLLGEDRLRFVLCPNRWRWDRWYSRTPLLAFFSGMLARLHTQHALVRSIARRHAERPYDVVYQFSQPELGGLRRHQGVLPPIVVHLCDPKPRPRARQRLRAPACGNVPRGWPTASGWFEDER